MSAIWVDLANSPQVLFFAPIVEELRARGHRVTLTIRDFAQTRELADQRGLAYAALGHHGGRRLSGTATATLGRAWELARWARPRRFDLAVSSNVYSHAVACRVLGLPLVNLYDYDPNPANHLAFRLARRVIVPAPFPDAALRRFGAAGKAVRYPGVKEQVYLSGFAGDPGFRTRHGWRDGDVMVVMRPPSDWSPYHRFPNPLFDALVRHAAAQEGVQIVFLPRIPEQAEQIRTLALSNLTVPTHAFDGPDLVHHADLVISAGGTMNREAAVLGTPAYTAYAGELGATDRHLMALGRLTHIRSAEEFGRIAFAARDRRAAPLAGEQLVSTIADQILA